MKSEKGTIMHNQLCNEILINKGDHCSHQCQFPHWGLAHEDYFCAQTFGIFEYSRILYFCSIRNTNTLSCVHLKYEYIFMRHPAVAATTHTSNVGAANISSKSVVIEV